ncbi:hypothetical protein KSP40_PGU020023 [Platanthera guangdongensis]|uniref:BZIP domain-containing protein n=1 Tax=Platanthera guangdongensis TaxID=2320717 RepID=A0ABR2N4H6_9ASPA
MLELVAADSSPPEIDSISNPEFLDPHIFPDDFYTRSSGPALEIDLDIDFEVPDPLSHPPHQSSDRSPPESGVSITSSSPATSVDINACSLESGHSANCSDSGGELKRDDERSEWGTKRKKEREEVSGNSNTSPRSRKFRRSEDVSSCVFTAASEEEEKRKARLIRNRESAQLSRQRKKNYVEELEDKVRSMQSTITELNSKISVIMAENSSLKQQLGGVPSPSVPIIQNSSESLPALLYVPRNGKHVKINGNLIINSVLASEKAVTEVKSRNQPKQTFGTEVMETSLAIARNLPSGLSLSARDIDKQTQPYGSSIEHTGTCC